jgi:hypothetical protein
MGTLVIFPVVAAMALVALSAHAEVPDVCSVAFTQGIRNNFDVYTAEDRFNLYKQRILKLSSDTYQHFVQSAQSLDISVPIADDLLGLTGSNETKEHEFRQKFDEFKSATYSEARYRHVFQQHDSAISADLLHSWEQCTRNFYSAWLEQKGLVVSVTPLGDYRTFVVTLDVRPAMLNKVNVIGIEPTGQVACSYGPNKLVQPGKTVIGTAAFSMTCTKNPGVAIPFIVNVAQAGRSSPVTVPAEGTKVAELTQQVAELRAELAELRRTNETAHDRITSQIPTHVELSGDDFAPGAHDGIWWWHNESSKCGGSKVTTGVTPGNNALGSTVAIHCASIVLKP